MKELEKDGAHYGSSPPSRLNPACSITIGSDLPYSIAVTDKEAEEIERFMARGGIVFGDDPTGRMDGRCHWRTQPLWNEQTKGFVCSEPRNVGVRRDFGGPSLVSIRDFGESRLTGVLPEKAVRVHLPDAKAVSYDLLRGGIATQALRLGRTSPC